MHVKYRTIERREEMTDLIHFPRNGPLVTRIGRLTHGASKCGGGGVIDGSAIQLR